MPGARLRGLSAAFATIGAAVRAASEVLRAAVHLYGGAYGAGAITVSNRVVSAQVYFTGVEALPVVLGIGVLVAAALMWVGFRSLQGLGAEEAFGQLVRLAVLLEIGPLLTALVVAARSGTAIATDVATMKIRHEIAALEAHGVNPLAYLVVPRILGVCAANVVLTVLFCAAVYLACAMIAPALSVPSVVAARLLVEPLQALDVPRFLLKAAAFGAALPALTLARAFAVTGDANAIPRAGSQGVVDALIAIFTIDAAFAWFLHG